MLHVGNIADIWSPFIDMPIIFAKALSRGFVIWIRHQYSGFHSSILPVPAVRLTAHCTAARTVRTVLPMHDLAEFPDPAEDPRNPVVFPAEGPVKGPGTGAPGTRPAGRGQAWAQPDVRPGSEPVPFTDTVACTVARPLRGALDPGIMGPGPNGSSPGIVTRHSPA